MGRRASGLVRGALSRARLPSGLRAVEWSPQADPPVAFSNLDLAEGTRPELGDQGRQEQWLPAGPGRRGPRRGSATLRSATLRSGRPRFGESGSGTR
ncbi:MAG: hypothetical protein WKF78_03780 [Candidatus Limnocylindrales bacterium]